VDYSNVLFILTDQWPAWAFGYRGADIPTPNIDRLAATGTVFDNAFTSCPLCTPARGSLLTARWPHQTGVLDNHSIGYSLQESLPLSQSTWIDGAVGKDFHVGYFGKWHLGPVNPEKRGAHRFDPEVEVSRNPFDPEIDEHSYQKTFDYYRSLEAQLLRGIGAFWGDSKKPKEQLQPFPAIDRGVDFLRNWVADSQQRPYFLTVSCSPPHFPHHLPAEYSRLAAELRPRVELPASLGDDCEGRPWFHSTPFWACMDTSQLDEEAWKTIIAYSHAHIAMVDEAIGRLLDELDRLGLTDTTTVVFSSDHGDMEGAHRRFDKGPYFYEEVWRIPLVIRAPGSPVARQPAFVSLLDVGETLFDLAGCPEPERAGRSLLPLLGASRRPRDWPDRAMGTYSRYNGYCFEVRAIRDERFKYVWNPQDRDELYDLREDPHEMRNLTGRESVGDREQSLRRQLLAWLEQTGDDLPHRLDELLPAGTVVATGEAGP
jgi:arylsulfatase A-like enzyme